MRHALIFSIMYCESHEHCHFSVIVSNITYHRCDTCSSVRAFVACKRTSTGYSFWPNNTRLHNICSALCDFLTSWVLCLIVIERRYALLTVDSPTYPIGGIPLPKDCSRALPHIPSYSFSYFFDGRSIRTPPSIIISYFQSIEIECRENRFWRPWCT